MSRKKTYSELSIDIFGKTKYELLYGKNRKKNISKNNNKNKKKDMSN